MCAYATVVESKVTKHEVFVVVSNIVVRDVEWYRLATTDAREEVYKTRKHRHSREKRQMTEDISNEEGMDGRHR